MRDGRILNPRSEGEMAADEFSLDAQIEQGLKEGKISLQVCAKCGMVNSPMKTRAGVTFCAECQNEFLKWIAGRMRFSESEGDEH